MEQTQPHSAENDVAVVQEGIRCVPPEPTHTLNEYGTTDCPVERVRAFADDGECSACGGRVFPPGSGAGEV